MVSSGKPKTFTKTPSEKGPAQKAVAAAEGWGSFGVFTGFEAWQTACLNTVKTDCCGSWELPRRVGAF